MKDLPRLVVVRLLHDPSIARYLDTATQAVVGKQVLLMTEKFVACRRLMPPSSFAKFILECVNSVKMTLIFVIKPNNLLFFEKSGSFQHNTGFVPQISRFQLGLLETGHLIGRRVVPDELALCEQLLFDLR